MVNCESEFCGLGSFGIVRQAKCDWRQSRIMSCDSELKERRLGPRGSDGEGKSRPETCLANDAPFQELGNGDARQELLQAWISVSTAS